MAITNEQELKRLVVPELQKAVDHTMNEILKQNKEEIEDVVYSYQPSVYERTNEFKDAAWETTQDGEGDASGTFQYAPDNIHIINIPQHAAIADGKDVGQGQSVAEYLADIIYQGENGIFPMPPRNAFKQLDSWLSNTQLRELFEDGLRRTSLIWKRSRGGITKKKHDKL